MEINKRNLNLCKNVIKKELFECCKKDAESFSKCFHDDKYTILAAICLTRYDLSYFRKEKK